MVNLYIGPNTTGSISNYRPFHMSVLNNVEIENGIINDTNILSREALHEFATDYNDDYQHSDTVTRGEFIKFLNDLYELQNRR